MDVHLVILEHFNHFYGYAPRRIKCAEPPLASTCIEIRKTAPMCRNCQGSHIVNYKKCQTLLKVMSNRRTASPNTLFQQNPGQTISSLPNIAQPHFSAYDKSNEQLTYASKLTGSLTSTSHLDTRAIIVQLSELMKYLSCGGLQIKEALITIISIITLLLNQNV